ncbi:hypothetical protein CVV65_05520 [Kyrpidia spormannii]|uniref:Uncharacterized protein YyaB-like PH domain-containing protein n=1 Tax=Kyrpidia spormannii TaxID=2055160 RepID=A0A2K8N537_9BACL|nr:PH domain-containing protein [Kyrpidia spormannii]ATY84481.1 hypothetical protein CVV65_05520 [Kyrpidia spormannii]
MKRFSSRRDVLFYGLVIPIFVCCIALTVIFALKRAYLPWIGFLLLDGFILWISLCTYYEFSADSLAIISGPFKRKVEYWEIHAVFRTRDATAAPALARNRLSIVLKSGRRVLVSPSNEPEFLNELRKRNEDIEFSGVL